jgi:hypothetical protein
MEKDQTIQQIPEMLARMEVKMDANQSEMKADRKAYHEEMMAMVDAYHERMIASLGKTEADTEKTEPDPGTMQYIEEHQEIPKGEAAVMPVGGPISGAGSAIWPRSAARRGRKGPREIVDPGGSRLPPAGRCRVVQKWHGARGTSLEILQGQG